MNSKINPLRALAVAITAVAGISLGSAAIAAESGPFSGLAGSWAGNGNFELEDGSKERIRCRATYAVNGDATATNLNLRCASDSYKIELQTNVVSQGNRLSGSWSEATRGVSGMLEGTAGKGNFQLNVSSPVFSAKLHLVTQGSKQNVTITSDSQLKSARISLAR